jgi:hypothetical protein
MASAKDAELILKLYELRTEATMRAARKFLAGFNPASFDELLALHRDAGSDRNAYWRQVTSYWEMASAFVLHGALDPDLFVDSNGEPFFIYAKFTPFLEDYSKLMGQPFMPKFAKLLETYPAMQEKYAKFLARLQAAKK